MPEAKASKTGSLVFSDPVSSSNPVGTPGAIHFAPESGLPIAIPTPKHAPSPLQFAEPAAAAISVPKLPERVVAQPLHFVDVPKPAPKPAAKVAPIFADHGPSKTQIDAVSSIMAQYPALVKNRDRFDRQLKQLDPLEYGIVANWGQTAVESCANHSLQLAALSRQFYNSNGSELLEQTLHAIAPNTAGLFKRLTAKKVSLDVLKPAVSLLKRQLSSIDPDCIKWVEDVTDIEHRAICCLASLSAANQIQQPTDLMIAGAVEDRLNLTRKAIQQLELAKLQVLQLRQTIREQMVKCDELLLNTIPAFELINQNP